MDNYTRIIRSNLESFFDNITPGKASALGAEKKGDAFFLRAFGRECRIEPHGIWLDEKPAPGPCGIVISLYLLRASEKPCKIFPMISFAELPNSMPYAAAFSVNAQQVLVEHVPSIEGRIEDIMACMDGEITPGEYAGDFSFILRPVPKVALCYIFYRADEEFPASVTCLFSNNAADFLPTDALADLGEYTSKRICELVL